MGVRTILDLAQFCNLPDDDMRHELDEGELISMPPTKKLHWIAEQNINHALSMHLEKNRIGRICPSDAGFILSHDPPTMRQPDVTFIRTERAERTPDNGYVEGAPDLVVEVFSPSDSVPQLMRKTHQYLTAGALIVWIVYPERGEVHIFESGGSDRILTREDALDAPALLPGFSVAVKDLFV
jgi:Uma2 family endonuclease